MTSAKGAVRRTLRSVRRALRGGAPSTAQSGTTTAAPSAATAGSGPAKNSIPAPTHAARVRTAALAEGGEYGVAEAARTADWSGLTYVGGEPIEFAVPLASRMPELGYGVFANARVVAVSGYPVTAGDALLIDAVNVHEQSRFRSYARPQPGGPPTELDGEVINLATRFSTNNYGHALLDGLGRMGLLRGAGYDAARASHVIMPAFKSRTLNRLMDMAGVAEAALIVPEAGAHYACEHLVQATFPGRPRAYSSAPSDFARSLGIVPLGRDRRLLMLRRGAKRAIVNIDEVAALADDYGLETYEPADSAFSPADFAAASLVIAPHGAGLADIAFTAPGTAVVELLPDGHRYPYFATLAASSGLHYQAVRGASVSTERHADFTVDIDHVRRALDAALERPLHT